MCPVLLTRTKLVKEKYDNISSYLPSRWLYSNHPYTHNFVDVAINHGKVAAEAFLSYILKQQSQLPRSMTFDQFKCNPPQKLGHSKLEVFRDNQRKQEIILCVNPVIPKLRSSPS